MSTQTDIISIRIFDLYSGGQVQIRDLIVDLIIKYRCPELKNPLFNIIRELVTNGLKAIYKKVFYDTVVANLGIEDIGYTDWLKLFKTEIDTNNARNLAEQARLGDLGVDLIVKHNNQQFEIEISNPGAPTDVERRRIQTALDAAKDMSDFTHLFTEEDDAEKEGAGIGLPLIIMSLRGLGLDAETFRLEFSENKTQAFLTVPLDGFRFSDMKPVHLLTAQDDIDSIIIRTMRHGQVYVMQFDLSGSLIACSASFVERTGFNPRQPETVRDIIPDRFYREFIFGARSIVSRKSIENYRLRIPLTGSSQGAGSQPVLFNITGLLEGDVITTVWQPVRIPGQSDNLSEGSIHENLKLQGITRRYLSETVLARAQEAVRTGHSSLSEEVRPLTIVRSILTGVEPYAGHTGPAWVLNALNAALSLATRIVDRHNGTSDRISGSAMQFVFEDPLKAIAAAVELEMNFRELNILREQSGASNLSVRSGVHSGNVIRGDVGLPGRMEWAVVGAVVDDAGTIAQRGEPGAVLISKATYDKVRQFVDVTQSFQLQHDGKPDAMAIYRVQSVRFPVSGEMQTLKLPA